MPLFRAIGLGIGLIVIRTLMPDVFEGLEDTLLSFFSTMTEILNVSKDSLTHGQTAIGIFPQMPR